MIFAGMFSALCLLCLRYRKRAEEALPPLCLGAMVALFALALAGALRLTQWLCALPVAGLLAWLCRHGREGLAALRARLLTPQMLCLLLMGVLTALMCRLRYVDHGDEFNFWATEARSLWTSGGIVPASRCLTPRYGDYPMGAQLLQWLTLTAFGRWDERLLYFSLYFFDLILLLPLLSRLSFRRWPLIPLVAALCVLAPTALSSAVYSTLSVDGTLGFLLGYALCMLWQAKTGGRYERVCASLALCALVLTKQTGVLLAVLAAVFSLAVVRPKKRPWLSFLAPAVLWGFWQVYCRVNQLNDHMLSDGASVVASVLGGTWTRPAGYGAFLRLLAKGLMLFPLNTTGHSGTPKAWFGLPLLGWAVVFALCAYFWQRARGEKPRLMWFVLGSVLAYIALMALSFLTVFSGEVGRYANDEELMGFICDRYFSPLTLGLAYLTAYLAVSNARGATGRATSCALLALTLAFGNYPLLARDLVSGSDMKYQAHQARIAACAADNEWLSRVPEDAAVLYGAREPSFLLQYVAAPVCLRSAGDEVEYAYAADAENDGYRWMLTQDVAALPRVLYRVEYSGASCTLTEVKE